MKRGRRFGVERHIDLAKRLVALKASIDTWQRHRFLRVGQLDADQLFGGAHHFLGDALRRWRGLLLNSFSERDVNARRREPGDSDCWKHLHKGATVDSAVPASFSES